MSDTTPLARGVEAERRWVQRVEDALSRIDAVIKEQDLMEGDRMPGDLIEALEDLGDQLDGRRCVAEASERGGGTGG